MPSGPKKRLRARRKKHGSPATDANSDRETETMSVTGSMDVDDMESGLDTPGKAGLRPTSLDKEAVSSQTNEWVQVSDFDVGTPTSQIGENDPIAEDDISSVRRSMDKLGEWETLSGENLPERQEDSTNSLEEEPSEVEAASGHTSESYTNLPSPHPAGDKDGDCSDSDRIHRSHTSSSSSSSSEAGSPPPSLETFHSCIPDIGEEVSSATVPVSPDVGDEVDRDIVPAIEEAEQKEIVHQAAAGDASVIEETEKTTDEPEETARAVEDSHETEVKVDEVDDTEKTMEEVTPDVTESAENLETEVSAESNEALVEDEPVEESQEQDRAVVEDEPVESSQEPDTEASGDEESTVLSSSHETVDVPVDVAISEEAPEEEDKEVLPIAEEGVSQEEIPAENEKSSISLDKEAEDEAPTSSLVDVEDKNVDSDETVGSAADDKEIASASIEIEGKQRLDIPAYVSGTVLEKRSSDPEEVTADTVVVKELPTSGSSEPMALVEERHYSISTTPVDGNGTAKEKSSLEAKSSTGCCGVIYWLLGWDH